MRKLAMIIALATLVGCSGGSGTHVKTASVSGTLKIDGKPVEGVEVHFVTEKHAAFGRTDRDGKYRLTQGAEVGENKVFFSKIEGELPGGLNQEGMDQGQLEAAAAAGSGQPGAKKMGQIIAKDYNSAVSTKLKFTVPDGGASNADFDIPAN